MAIEKPEVWQQVDGFGTQTLVPGARLTMTSEGFDVALPRDFWQRPDQEEQRAKVCELVKDALQYWFDHRRGTANY